MINGLLINKYNLIMAYARIWYNMEWEVVKR